MDNKKEKEIIFCQDLMEDYALKKILSTGAMPVFVDSDKETLGMDPKALYKAFEEYPRAKTAIVSNLYGTPGRTNILKDVCESHGAVLVEFAEDPLSNAKEQKKKFENIDHYLNKKIKIYKMYKEGLGDLPVVLNPHVKNGRAKFWRTIMLVDKEVVEGLSFDYQQVTPEMIRKKLETQKVIATPIVKPLHLREENKKFDFISLANYGEHIYNVDYSISTDAYTRGLCLPCDVDLRPEVQSKIIEMIKSMFVRLKV